VHLSGFGEGKWVLPGRVFVRAARRSPIGMALINLSIRWLARFALAHSAGGPGALHDAGALAVTERMAMRFGWRWSRKGAMKMNSEPRVG
jgi:hypothetical protein